MICDLCDDPSVESKDVWERVRTRVGVHATSTGHSSGQTADDAVKGPTAGTEYRSPNNAYIAHMARYMTPKWSRVTAVAGSSQYSTAYTRHLELDQWLSNLSELFDDWTCY